MSRHTKTLTRSFAGGEMSPEMFGRMDDAYFQAGAATLLNMVPRPTGAAARRSGTRLVRETRDGTKIAHLFSFIFSQTQSFVVEASRAEVGYPLLDGGYFRFHQNGATMLYSQPDRYVAGQIVRPYPSRVVTTVTKGSNATFTVISHGLENGDKIQFVAGVVPGGFTAYTEYYAWRRDADTFYLKAENRGASPYLSSTDIGHQPVVHCWRAWGATASSIYWSATDHGLKPGDAVVLSMKPYQSGAGVPFVDFYVSGFGVDGPGGFRNSSGWSGLSWSRFGQQVMFVPDAGATMPSNIEAEKLYWTTGVVQQTLANIKAYLTISESFGGPDIVVGAGAKGKIRLAAMPLRKYGDGPYIGCNEVYYVSNLSPTKSWAGNWHHAVKLAYSKDEAARGGGFTFDPYGGGNIRIHRVYEPGEIVEYVDTNGPRNFICKKSNWRSPIEDDSRLVTLNRYNESSGRYPGGRTATRQANYWRELPGRSTGPVAPVTTSGTDSTDLTISVTASGDASPDVTHGWALGQAISFVRGDPPSGTSIGTTGEPTVYYISYLGTGGSIRSFNIKAAKDLSGDHIQGPAAGTDPAGNLAVQAWAIFNTDHTIDWPGHGLSNGNTVVFSASNERSQNNDHFGALSVAQTECPFGTTFYVREKTTDDFRVSATPSGPLIEFGAITAKYVVASADTIYELPHDYSEDELPQIATTQSNDVMTLASKDHPVAELRRRSATRWDLVDVEFGAAATIPGPLYERAITPGEQVKISATATDGSYGSYFVVGDSTHFRHSYSLGDAIYISGMPITGSGALEDGFYVIANPTQVGTQREARKVFLSEVDTNDRVTHGGNATGLDGRIRYGSLGEDLTHTYVVTAIDKNNEESPATDSLTVTNNLLVPGASNDIAWGASVGAIRYRVYKRLSGLYGMIGETDDLNFKDDNIGPDLAVSPPIPDTSLREESRITFDIDGSTVLWPDHGLRVGTPVVFYTSDHMPTRVNEGQTYYVANTSTGGFQITDSLETYDIIVFADDEDGEHMAVSGNFPAAVTYFEGRRVFGGSRALPQDIWMTASGTEADMSYSIPTVDSDRIYFRIASREGSAIRHLLPLSQLMMLSDSTEYRLTPANDDILTPTSISVRPQSFVGAGYPHPALVNNTVVFAAARGGHVRELGYSQDVLGYLTGDLSVRAAHLFDGFTIKDQAYSKAPLPIVWCVSSSGKLLGVTYIPEEKVGAWHQHTTPGGEFESVVSIPEGDEDAVYVVVKRGNKRYVERFADQYRGDTQQLPDAYYVDNGVTYTGTATTTITGLDHLDDESVGYLADGVAGTGTVTSGVLTLTKAASTVSVGLVYTSQIQTLPLTMMRVDAFGTGKTKNVNKVWVRLFESGAFKSGPTAANLRSSLTPSSGSLLTDLVQVTLPASWDDDGQIIIQQDSTLPFTVVGLTIEVASGG
jgi:hypothetical protein